MAMNTSRRHRVNINEPFHAHELTFSCYQKYPFLKAERTCQWLADAIASARERFNFSLWAFVFMPDHVHMIVYPRQQNYDISEIRKAIKAPVARKAIQHLETNSPEWIPRITRKRGDRTERLFWQSGGGYDRNISVGGTLLAMMDYIHANPVRKGLVDSPYNWRWSSAAWYLANREIPLPVDPIPPEWLE
jgi:putative transposase